MPVNCLVRCRNERGDAEWVLVDGGFPAHSEEIRGSQWLIGPSQGQGFWRATCSFV